jgi:hypothetical protein
MWLSFCYKVEVKLMTQPKENTGQAAIGAWTAPAPMCGRRKKTSTRSNALLTKRAHVSLSTLVLSLFFL